MDFASNDTPYSYSLSVLGLSVVSGWLWGGIWTDVLTSPVTGWTTILVQSDLDNALPYNNVLTSVQATQNVNPSSAPASGSFQLNFNGNVTPLIQWNDTAATIISYLSVMPGLSQVFCNGDLSLPGGFDIQFYSYVGTPPLVSVTNNTLGVTMTVTQTQAPSGPASTPWTRF